MHQKLVKAAALTHLKTGLTIVSHTGPDGPALAQLRILKEMGVSPEAFVWTHAQNGTMEGYKQAAKEDAWISLDNVSAAPERLQWFVNTLSQLKAQDLLDNVLISHDAGWYDVGQKNGGDFRPYTAIFTHLVPKLKKRGFSQKDIDMLLIENPKCAYNIRTRKF
jgi:phosphotriesterase-related protein